MSIREPEASTPDSGCAHNDPCISDAEQVNVADFELVAQLFRCLASPIRVAIVVELQERELCVHELVDHLSLSQPLVSQHLRILRDAHLIRRVRRGREVAYTLADSHIAHIVTDAVAHTQEEKPHDHHP